MSVSDTRKSLAFGRWLRQRRDACDLTQEKLADKAGCSHNTIRKLEKGDRNPSTEMVIAILKALNVPATEIPSLVALARLGSEATGGRLMQNRANAVSASLQEYAQANNAHVEHNLPVARNALVGRKHQREAIRKLLGLDATRLLTLHGPPGIGKTRLMLEAGFDMLPYFKDGVHFVPLADTVEPQALSVELARVLRLAEVQDHTLLDTIKSYLRDKQALLLLDNFEQIAAAAPIVADLLASCLHVKIVITSRWVLRIQDEMDLRVPSLSMPKPSWKPALEGATEYEAVQLFVQRAVAIDSAFRLTEENVVSVVEICKQLDALPLGIELAATWCRLMTPRDISIRLRDAIESSATGNLDLPPRQRTLSSAIEWSYQLLPADAARLLVRMSVFSGGATVEAIEAICVGERASIIDPLLTLIDANLVQRIEDQNGEARFTMLATIANYAQSKLLASPEGARIRHLYALFYTSKADTNETILASDKRYDWLDRIFNDHANYLSVLQWCVSEDSISDGALSGDSSRSQQEDLILLGMRLILALSWFWYYAGYFTEGRYWLKLLIERAEACGMWLIKALGAAYNALARLAWCQSDYLSALTASNKALEIARVHKDKVEIGQALSMVGITRLRQGSLDGSYTQLEEAVQLLRETDDLRNLAMVLDRFADATTWRKDYQSALRVYQEIFGIFQRLGDSAGMASEMRDMGNVALQIGNYATAASNLEQALSIDGSRIPRWDKAYALYSLAYTYQALGQSERSKQLYEQALDLFSELGVHLGMAGALRNLGYLTIQSGDNATTIELYSKYLEQVPALKNEYSTLLCLSAVACLFSRCGLRITAVELLSFVQIRLSSSGRQLQNFDRDHFDGALAGMRSQFSDAAWQDAWLRGQSMTIDNALGCAGSDLLRLRKDYASNAISRR